MGIWGIWGKKRGNKKNTRTRMRYSSFVGPARFVRAFRIFYLIWDWKTYTPQWNKKKESQKIGKHFF